MHDHMLAQQENITSLHGNINPETVDTLEEEIGSIAATVKSYHFTGGSDFEHLTVIIPESKMITLLSDKNWEYCPPEEQEAYDDKVIANNITDAQRSQLEMKHKR